MTNDDARLGRYTLKRVAWVFLLSTLFFSSLIWVAWAQKPDGEVSSEPLPFIDPALRLKIEPALLKHLIEIEGDQLSPVLTLGDALGGGEGLGRRAGLGAFAPFLLCCDTLGCAYRGDNHCDCENGGEEFTFHVCLPFVRDNPA